MQALAARSQPPARKPGLAPRPCRRKIFQLFGGRGRPKSRTPRSQGKEAGGGLTPIELLHWDAGGTARGKGAVPLSFFLGRNSFRAAGREFFKVFAAENFSLLKIWRRARFVVSSHLLSARDEPEAGGACHAVRPYPFRILFALSGRPHRPRRRPLSFQTLFEPSL